MRAAAICICLAACGRRGFDPVPDAPLHDEDGDGVPDVRDNCPQLANADQSDLDGDGVGDICDPDPTVPAQSIALFTPCIGADARFAIPSDWTFDADAWHFADTAMSTELYGELVVTDVDLWVELDLISIDGAFPYQLTLGIGDEVTPYYFGELFVDAVASKVGLTEYDGSNYIPLAMTPLPAMHPGAMILHLQARAMPEQWTWEPSWPGEPYDLSAAPPTYAGGTRFGLYVGSLEVAVRNITVIVTSP